MKANLTVREPKLQERWREQDLYALIRQKSVGKPMRRPPRRPALRQRRDPHGAPAQQGAQGCRRPVADDAGLRQPYVPGWDCHGLPIEHKVMKDLGSKAAGMGTAEVRELCHAEAMKWVEHPARPVPPPGDLGRLGQPVPHPRPSLRGRHPRRPRRPARRGVDLPPAQADPLVHEDRTALAEAELEYSDETSPSIYVNFPMVAGVPEAWGPGPWHAMIWTTTPWTLPANVAIAAHPDLDYVGLRYTDPDDRPARPDDPRGRAGRQGDGPPGRDRLRRGRPLQGADLEHASYRHVFLDRESPIVLAPYVTVEDGTGLVHTAPGHGAEDYQTGLAYGLPTLSPVDASGRYTDEVPRISSASSLQGQPEGDRDGPRRRAISITSSRSAHSYPHCWRCKKPVIFRATEQWFVAVDHADLRARTLRRRSNEDVRWHPAWGRSRIEAMVSLRPDWCISRQRAWGVPIPALGCESLRHPAPHRRDRPPLPRPLPPGRGRRLVLEAGRGDPPPGRDLPEVRRDRRSARRATSSTSGSSRAPAIRAVLKEPSYGLDLTRPTSTSKARTSTGAGSSRRSSPPSPPPAGRRSRGVLTHGFIVDEQGKKMAKSGGNAVSAVKATEQYGADVLRLYVASLDYADDVRMSEKGSRRRPKPTARSATPSDISSATSKTTPSSTRRPSRPRRSTRSTSGRSASSTR